VTRAERRISQKRLGQTLYRDPLETLSRGGEAKWPVISGGLDRRRQLINAVRFLNGAVNRRGRFIRSTVGITFEQLCQASLVEIAYWAFAIGLDPFGMLRAKVVVNLELKRSYVVVRVRPGNLCSHRFRSDEHGRLDSDLVELVQIDALKV
jgi:hypothetical protein